LLSSRRRLLAAAVVVTLAAVLVTVLEHDDTVARVGLAVTVMLLLVVLGLVLAGMRRTEKRFLALVADLQALGPGDTLRNALRRSLGDPHLDIAYVRAGSGGWIDEVGRQLTAPVATAGRAVTPVERGGKPIAALVHDPALLRTPELLRAAVAEAS
jgi:hypothetical protein